MADPNHVLVDARPPFLLVEEAVLHLRLRPSTLAVYLAVLSFVNRHHGVAWPSYQTLAARANVSRRTAIQAVDELVKVGLIRVTARQRPDGSDTSNVYAVIPAPRPAPPQAKPTAAPDAPTPAGGAEDAPGECKTCTPGGVDSAPREPDLIEPDLLEPDLVEGEVPEEKEKKFSLESCVVPKDRAQGTDASPTSSVEEASDAAEPGGSSLSLENSACGPKQVQEGTVARNSTSLIASVTAAPAPAPPSTAPPAVTTVDEAVAWLKARWQARDAAMVWQPKRDADDDIPF